MSGIKEEENMSVKFSRRQMLRSALLALASAPVVQACAPKAATPVPAQVAPTAAAPKEQAAVAAGPAKISLSLSTYADPRYDWMRYWGEKWASEHPNIDLKIEDVIYGETQKKGLAMLATGTLWDASYTGIRYFSYLAAKGAYLPLEELVQTVDPDMDDLLPAALEDCSFDGKLYALPFMYHPGNPALIFVNLDTLGEKGITPPTDEWKVSDFVEIAAKTTDKEARIFGTNFRPGSYHDMTWISRRFHGDMQDAEGKKCIFNTDPNTIEASRWCYDLRAVQKCAPLRDESEGIMFAAGNITLQTGGSYSLKPNATAVADKFKWDAVLFPTGPDGYRGYQGFTEMYSVARTSKYPQEAYELINLLCSKEVGIWSVFNNDFNPNARKSVWADPEVLEAFPIFERCLNMMNASEGPFPMPYNLRFVEANDVFANVSNELFLAEVPFEEGAQRVQTEVQAILDLPRP